MDYVLLDRDQAIFQPGFGAATVVPLPGTLQASGPATVKGMKMCVVGDESTVSVQGCIYTTASHTIPGTGTLQITGLASDQLAQNSSTGGKKLMLKGQSFQARFSVQTPAQQPSPAGSPVPDPNPSYTGQGNFQTSNSLLRAS